MKKKTNCFIFMNVNENELEKINVLINQKNFNNPCVLMETHTNLNKNYNFNFPLYLTRDIIPVSSPEDEFIYKESSEFREDIIQNNKIFFKKVNFMGDFLNYISIPYEQILILIKSIEFLSISHDAIFICISHQSYSYLAIKDCPIFCNIKYIDLNKEYKVEIKKEHKNLLKKILNIKPYFFSMYSFYFFVKKTIKETINNLNLYLKSFFSKKTTNEKNKIIFLKTTSEPLYEQNFLPVCQKINELYPDIVSFIKLDYIQKDVFSNIRFHFLSELKKNLLINYFIVFNSLNFKLKNQMKKNIINKKNIIHSILLLDFLKNKAIFLSRIKYILDNISMFDHFFKLNKPLCLYKECTISIFDNMFNALGKKYNVPIIASVHASIVSTKRSFAILPTDYITIIGDNQKNILLENGFKKEQIIAVGQPELDTAINLWTIDNSLKFIKNNFNDYKNNKKTILISTSVFDSKNEITWVKSLCEFVSKQNDIQIFIKPHRGFETYYGAVKNYLNVFVSSENYSIYPFIQIADLVLTDNSHAGKLAIFFGKKLSVINISGHEFPFNKFNEENVANIIYSIDFLIEFIYSFMNEKNQHDSFLVNYNHYINENFIKADGKTSERIIDFLLQISMKNKKD